IWHQQLVHHDLWDYDLPQAPKLLTIHKDGRAIDVVAQATKHGFLFVFDRKTGEPIWPIEERPVPQSDLPGEHSSPTQPFPTKPAPFAVQSFTEKDINPFLPKDEQDTLRERLRTSRKEGLFTPPSFQGSIEMPGNNGGAHFPRGSPLVTAGGLVFVATAQDRRLRAYDRDNGKVLWSKELPSGSEGIPATYEVNGRQFLALAAAAGDGLFAPTAQPGAAPQ